jgi:predicted amidophosphoribosyltransferase
MDADRVRRALADALAFLLPVECAGCGADDVALCDACAGALAPTRATRTIDGIVVGSGLVFEGEVARVIRSLKEDGRLALARPLARALVCAAPPLEGVDVVVIPTSRTAMRRRGYRVTDLLARRAGWRPVPLLRRARATGDQRALGRFERAENIADSMRAVGAAGRRILLVDDVVTTGATLREAARALREGGADVVGAVCVAATPKRRPQRMLAVRSGT